MDILCSVCDQEKDESEFAIDNSVMRGRSYICKDCKNSKTRKKYSSSKPLGGRKDYKVGTHGENLKKCKGCEKILDLSLFNKKGDGRYEGKCKTCM